MQLGYTDSVAAATLACCEKPCKDDAYLEEDVGRVEVPMADALPVYVLHAGRHGLRRPHYGCPCVLHVSLGERAIGEEAAHGPSVAELL